MSDQPTHKAIALFEFTVRVPATFNFTDHDDFQRKLSSHSTRATIGFGTGKRVAFGQPTNVVIVTDLADDVVDMQARVRIGEDRVYFVAPTGEVTEEVTFDAMAADQFLLRSTMSSIREALVHPYFREEK